MEAREKSEQAIERPWITPEAAREAIKRGDGKGIRIAIIDSGVEAEHPRLRGMRLRDSIGILEKDGRLVTNTGEGFDVYGHGTAVAGIIHAIAPEAEIGSFRVLDPRNLSRAAIIQEGVYEAIRRGYNILNCSFGCKGLPKYVFPHKQWIDDAFVQGVHVVAACNNADPREPEWPAHFPSVISVAIASQEDTSGNSNSDSPGFFHIPGELVEFAAPGENIEVAWSGCSTRIETGSSFAAPVVSAVVARLLSIEPGLPPAHVLDLLPRLAVPSKSAVHFARSEGRPSG